MADTQVGVISTGVLGVAATTAWKICVFTFLPNTWTCLFHCLSHQDLTKDAAFMDKYSRQIGAYGIEAMGKV